MRAALLDAIETHSAVLFRVAQRIVHDPAVAEDMCQTAFLRAWQERDRIADPAALKGWLARVTVNESLQWLRRQKIEQRRLAVERFLADHHAQSPLEVLGDREVLLMALGCLPEQTRAVVLLRTVHGYTGREVAELMGLSDVQVSRTLHAGLDQLRTAIPPPGSESTAPGSPAPGSSQKSSPNKKLDRQHDHRP